MSNPSLSEVVAAINSAIASLNTNDNPVADYITEKVISTQGSITNFGYLDNVQIKSFTNTIQNDYWNATLNNISNILVSSFTNFFNIALDADKTYNIQSGFQDGQTYRYNFKADVSTLSYKIQCRMTSAFGGKQLQSYMDCPIGNAILQGQIRFKVTSQPVVEDTLTKIFNVVESSSISLPSSTIYDVFFENLQFVLPTTTSVGLYVWTAVEDDKYAYVLQGSTSKDLSSVQTSFLPQVQQTVQTTLNQYFSSIVLPITTPC
jgi:hypothetical protein